MANERRLMALALGNLGFGIAAAMLAPTKVYGVYGAEGFLMVPSLASNFCQAVLLPLWVAYAGAPTWRRVAGLVAGTAYLEALAPAVVRREIPGIVAVAVAATTAVCYVGRALGIRIARREAGDEPPGARFGPLRFSIRGLMLVTAAVAVLCAGARALQESSAPIAGLPAAWALCIVAVGLAALWASLGDARPRARGPAVPALASLLGASLAYAFGAHARGWVYIISTMLLYATVLLGSLLVVRSCGYRLVRRAASPAGPPDGAGN
ncbi:hypothetical protein OJF2_76560 [Aquisphaera giovannonii]|uniref:Uncharacterized protein n=1 Tax=Aquisphaera giovannonii TaxID=406548 RepID=A0A5B9WFM6_9BACT|nr:hypothetical protein [Aquisphaera giovannonii]QEH39044.1 hypothetical protein OJF2_76560 [Aquisphaera giovannonii]